jgi:hypothetical protein
MHTISCPGGGSSAAITMAAGPSHQSQAPRAASPGEPAWHVTEAHNQVAGSINELVIGRLFSAGLDLQIALGLMDGHRAGQSVEHAVAEVDQAIKDLRDILFSGMPA